jgi:hypothetical protein
MKTQIIQNEPEAAPHGAAAPPAPAAGSGGRTVAVVLGSIAAVLGAVIALGGGGILAAFGSDGVLSTSRSGLSTPTSALMSQTAAITDTAGASDVLGDTSLRISARADAGRPLFVGIGPARDVTRYLSGAAVDEVTDFDVDPFRVERNRLAGTGTPAAPTSQSFWIARAAGPAADVDWKVRDGDYRVVIMNADGARGVATRISAGVEVPYLPDIAIGMLIGGVLLAGAGVAAIVLSRRSSTPRAARS